MNTGQIGDVVLQKAPVRRSRSISISEALDTITKNTIEKAIEAYDTCEEPLKITATTIRLPENVCAFYSVLAERLGISFQSAILISLSGLIDSERSELRSPEG